MSSEPTTVTVPPPVPPDDPAAWYAPAVRMQYEPMPGVVVTIWDGNDGFEYRVREPPLSEADERQLDRIETHFEGVAVSRPLTRERTRERMRTGFEPKYRKAIDRLLDGPPAADRRVRYHALCRLRGLGALTPLALDERIEVADAVGDRLVVHTERFAPVRTQFPADSEYFDRFVSERLTRYTVPFAGFDVPVVVYREHLVGGDAFTIKYAVREPDLLPGDRDLIERCKDRIWEGHVDEVIEDRTAFVETRSRSILARLLADRDRRTWIDAITHRLKTVLADRSLAVPPVDDRFSPGRLDDLIYYVLRDYVGEGKLTIPIRDPNLEDIEANRVGERVKVVPRSTVAHSRRMPTNLTFESEAEFVDVVTHLAAEDGAELTASNPSAKVNLDPPEVGDDVTIRCAVALPAISEDGPHVSIRKQAPKAMTPVDLLENGSISVELVALLWQLYEHRCVILFSGPTGVGKTTLMNAHMPFIRYEDRPISIDEGSREVRLPHETGVALSTRDHEDEFERVSMADLMTECNYLNPDVEVIAEVNTPASFETFGETLNTGHGVVGTTHAEDVEKLVNRVVEQGLAPYLLREIDLVVFPKHVDGERYVGEAVEFLDESGYRSVDGHCGTIEKNGETIYWNQIARKTGGSGFQFAYSHPNLVIDDDDAEHPERIGERLERSAFDPPTRDDSMTGSGEKPQCAMRVFHRIAERTDRPVQAVEAEFHRKVRYVRYFERAGIDDFDELFDFLADLDANEAATVERIRRQGDQP